MAPLLQTPVVKSQLPLLQKWTPSDSWNERSRLTPSARSHEDERVGGKQRCKHRGQTKHDGGIDKGKGRQTHQNTCWDMRSCSQPALATGCSCRSLQLPKQISQIHPSGIRILACTSQDVNPSGGVPDQVQQNTREHQRKARNKKQGKTHAKKRRVKPHGRINITASRQREHT